MRSFSFRYHWPSIVFDTNLPGKKDHGVPAGELLIPGCLIVLFLFGIGIPDRAYAQSQTGTSPLTRAAADLAGVEGGASEIGDVNGDGNKDVFVAGVDSSGSVSATLYLGNGKGNFTEAGAGIEGVGGGPSAAIRDVSGDGNADLLVTGTDDFFNATATLYLGNGDGTFQKAGAGLTGVSKGATSIADIDGDGDQDLLITGEDGNGNETATLYLGNGDGTFSEANAGLTGVVNGATSIADVDGDGNQDLLIAGTSDTGNFTPSTTLYLGNGDGTFNKAGAGLTDVRGGPATSIGDLNGDNNDDLLVAGVVNFEPAISVYLGNGDGTFSEAGAGLAGFRRASSSIRDVDGDGNQDILLAGESKKGIQDVKTSVKLYLGDGTGSFSEVKGELRGVTDPNDITTSLSTGDLYGDGDPDFLITGTEAFFDAPSARLYVNRTNQSSPNQSPQFARTFVFSRPLAPGLTLRRRYVEAGDPDGDSLAIKTTQGGNASISDAGDGISKFTFSPDRTQGTQTIDIRVEARDPDGASDTFSLSIDVPGSVAAWPDSLSGVQRSSSSMADVNNDGNLDILITGNERLGPNTNEPSATLYLGDGTGTFEEAGASLTGVDLGSNSIADVNNDSNADLLITGTNSNGNPSTTLYLGNGDGTFSTADAGLVDLGDGAASATGDFNNDGNTDLFLIGQNENSEGESALYLGNGDGTFQTAGASFDDDLFSDASAAPGDVNGDGNLDLLVTTDPVTLYLGNGDGTFSNSDFSRGALTTGLGRGSASIGDLNNDGDPDLLVTGRASDKPVAELWIQNTDGSFDKAAAGLTGVDNSSSSIADVDGDGNQDVLITGTNDNGRPTATLYLGNGDGTFSEAGIGMAGVGDAPSLFNTRPGSSTSIGDVDGDSDPDMLVTGLTSTARSASSIVYENFFANPIPVELARFSAKVSERTARLAWQTASETNNAGFEVQQKTAQDAAWKTLGFVKSKAKGGTTTETKSYQYAVEDLSVGSHWFRLKQVDLDGTSNRTDPVRVDVRMRKAVTLAAPVPNPASRHATLSFAVRKRAKTTVRLYNTLGQRIATLYEDTPPAGERQTVRINASDLPSGVYFLRLQTGSQIRTRKLTVTR